MTDIGIGHNNPPKVRTFKRRWASAIFDCDDRNKPAGAVAMAFRLYHDMDSDGRGRALSNLVIASACGMSERSVRTFKGWLLDAGFVRVLARGGRGGDTEYQACIPGDIQPAIPAAQIKIQPAAITDNSGFNRQPLPAIDEIQPAIRAGKPIQAARIAGEIKTSPAPARAEENIIIYNNINNLPKKTTYFSEQVSAREALDSLESKLLDACNGALADPVNCLGLLSLAIPTMWINEGCDLELDILPTLRAVGKAKHGDGINSWHYFTKPIAQAKKRREAGLPSVTGPQQKPSQRDRYRKAFKAVAEEKGGE